MGSAFFVYLPVRQLLKSVNEINPGNLNPLKVTENVSATNIHINKEDRKIPMFIPDDRQEAIDNHTVMIIHSVKEQAEKYMQQARAKNYKVIVAETVADGIILAEEFHPKAIMLAVGQANNNFDFIILHLGLPDYSGKELLEKLKDNHTDIPKGIIYTGKEISKDEHKNLN